MAQQKITLRKLRDFGENYNETFGFIRQNFSPLLKSFFAVAGVFMLVHSIALAMYSSEQSSLIDDIFKDIVRNRSVSETFGWGYFLNLGSYYLLYVAMQTAITAYFMAYEEKEGEKPGMADVWKYFSANFFKIFFYSIPAMIVIIIGTLFCIAPGIYFAVVLTPFASVVMVEGRSFTDSFNRCFTIIRENFWISFAIYLVSYIIYSMMSGIITFIIGAIVGVTTFVTTKEMGAAYVIILSLASVFQFIFYIIFYVSVMLHYYNLAERTDGTGLLSRIDDIGNKEQAFFDNSGDF